METYIQHNDEQGNPSHYVFEGLSIPHAPGNRHFAQMQQRVLVGDAEIEVYAKPAAEALMDALDQIAADRYIAESGGIVWADPATGTPFYLDTSIDSQNRFASARLAVESGERVDGGVWKCAELSTGSPVLTFRPTLNSEVVLWSGLVHTHVQQCFEAEAIATQKVLSGEETSFAVELALLRGEAPEEAPETEPVEETPT